MGLARHGVLGTNTPDVLNEGTADVGWALMMAAARRVAESERWVRAGARQRWSHDLLLGQDVHGKTLGVIGMGRIGQVVARRCASGALRRPRLTCSRASRASTPPFLELENVVLTPHNAPGSEATRRTMALLAADNLIAALGCGPHAGRPANPVNPEVLAQRSH